MQASVWAGTGVGNGVSESHLMDRLSDFFFASCIAWSMEHGQKTGHASARTLFGETTTAVKRVLLLAPNYLAANNRNSCKAIVFLTPMHPWLAASTSS